MLKTTPRIFVPLWHPPEAFESGGLYRARRTLESARGFEFEVVDSETTKLERSSLSGRLRIYPARWAYASRPSSFRTLRAINYGWTLACATALGLASARIDAVYVPTSELPHVALAGFLVARLRRVPLILCNLNIRGVDVWRFNRMLHDRAAAVITISRALAMELRADGVRAPILVGTVGVDDRAVPHRGSTFDGIFVGRLTPEKGARDFVPIWSEVVKLRPGATLLVVGPAQPIARERLEREVADAGLMGLVEIRGTVSDDEKWQAYATAGVCIFPSRVEGFGIVPIEAHFARLPVVAYDLPVYAETIGESPAATLVPVGDVVAFARETVAYLAGDVSDRVERARVWAARFSWIEAAAVETSLIRRVLEDNKKMSLPPIDNAQKDDRFSERVVEVLLERDPELGALLDLGCGTGGILQASIAHARSLAGVDLGAGYIAEARRRVPAAQLVIGDVTATPFTSGAFDTVTFCDVIEHLEAPARALGEIRRLLRPGGTLLVTTPNSDSIVRRLTGRRWFGLADPSHMLFFTPFSLRVLLERSGFEVGWSGTLSASHVGFISAALDQLKQGGTIAIVATRRSG